MSTTPTYLQDTGSGSWNSFEYHFYQTVNSGLNDERAVYGLAVVSGSGQFSSWKDNAPWDHSISVYTNTNHTDYNVWGDYGSNHPYTVTDNGSSVVLSSTGAPNLFTFNKPTTASWISSGPSLTWSTTSQPSFTTTQVSGGTTNTYTWDSSNSTSTRLVYTTSTTNGLVFTVNSNGTGIDIDCNNATYGFNDPDNPEYINTINSQSGSSGTVTNVSVSDTIYMFNASGSHWCDFVIPAFTLSGSGSGGSGSGGTIGTLSGGSSPEIKDITFTKASDTIVYLSFNWQNLNTAYLFVDSGGTVTQTNIALGGLGNSGTVAGSGYLTNMQDGDKVWIANTDTVASPYIHRYIHWSYDKTTGKVSATAFFKDNGGNGFNQNADMALVRVIGATYSHGYSLLEAQADPVNGHVNHDGTLQTMSLDAEPGTRWAVTQIDASQYGSGYKVPSVTKKVFSNFW